MNLKTDIKKIYILFFLFLYFNSFAQPIVTDTSLVVRPYFALGETKTYLVTEDSRIDFGPMIPVKAESVFRITFKVLDTTKGYKILYLAETIMTSNKRWALESFKAKVSDHVSFTFKINKEGWIDSFSFNKTRRQLLQSFDSIAANEKFSESDQIGVSLLRKDLENGKAVEGFMKPLMLFNDLFTKQVFRNRKDFVAANRWDIFYRPTLPGVMILELKDVNKTDSTANLTVSFVGNRDSMFKYANPVFQQIHTDLTGKPMKFQPSEMRNDFKRKYTIMLHSGWPVTIDNLETEFYQQKITYKTSMKLVEN